MTEISRAALFGKLNPLAYKAIEGATVFCKLRGNPYVELVHWLHQILQTQDSDLHRIVRHFELDPSKLAADITAALDRLPRGATSISDLSPQVEEAVERGWVFGTLMFGESQVRTGHLLFGAAQDHRRCATRCTRSAASSSGSRRKRSADDFDKILGGSPEAALAAADGSRVGAPGEAIGGDGAGGDGQAGGTEAILGRSDRAGAQRRDRSDRRPRLRKSARSSMC